MHIVLGILKVIGIILLVLLALIAVLLLTVLFVPVRYQVSFHRETSSDGPKAEHSSLSGKIHISYLAHLLDARLTAEGTRWGVRIKLLWFWNWKQFGPLEEENPESVKAKEQTIHAERAESSQHPVQTDRRLEESQEGPRETADTKAVNTRQPADRRASEEKSETNSSRQAAPEKTAAKTEKNKTAYKENLTDRLQKLIAAVTEFMTDLPRRLADLIQLIIDALQDGGDRIDEVQSRFEAFFKKIEPFIGADARSWYGKAGRKLKRALHHYLPGRAEGSLTVGTGSPDTTALVIGLLYTMLPADSKRLELKPDFYEQALHGDLMVKGHIRLHHLTWMAVTLLLDKETRTMIRRIMHRRGGK